MSDLRRRLRDIEGYSPPDLWENIASGGPRALTGEPGPARKPVVVVLALAMALAGLILVMRAFGGRESRPASQAPADVARVVCLPGAIRVETPVVRAHPDGIHVVFENPGEVWGFEFHPESFEYGSAMGDSFRGDIRSESTWSLPPGEVTVACLPGAGVAYFEPEAETATLTVVDPEGLYVPWELACDDSEQFRLRLAAPEDEDPEQVFRRVPGVRPSDDFRKPQYPETQLHWPTSLVFREGEAIARIGAPRVREEWELLVDACPDSGIAQP
ncbi:MAG: hypothetical protein ACRDI0_13875 [Actinomycetota bacterium]